MGFRVEGRRWLAVTASLGMMLACSGESSRNGGLKSVSGPSSTAGLVRAQGDPSPSPAVSPAPAPSPTARPPVSACPFGKGSLYAPCDRGLPSFLPEVDTAINLLIQQRPEIFDLAHNADTGMYKVLDTDAFYTGVVSNLQAAGFCANYDFKELQVKNSPDFSDQYDILLSTDHIRRGPASYRATCNPASFPADPADFIDGVRVAFFGINCNDGRTPPRNGEGLLPVGCVGYVTATPKDKNNLDVDARIVGHDIEWILPTEVNVVEVDNFPRVAFNKTLTGLAAGKFSLCAVVQGVKGCLHGEIIP